MSDETTTTEQPKAEAEKQGEPASETLGEGGVKALKAERERAKELEKQLNAATTKLTEIEKAQLSDLERAQREATEFKEAAEKAVVEALRFRIAAEKGINDNVDLILTASDEETMRRQADLWADRVAKSDTAPGPRADLTQGGSGDSALALNGDPLLDALKSKLGIN